MPSAMQVPTALRLRTANPSCRHIDGSPTPGSCPKICPAGSLRNSGNTVHLCRVQRQRPLDTTATAWSARSLMASSKKPGILRRCCLHVPFRMLKPGSKFWTTSRTSSQTPTSGQWCSPSPILGTLLCSNSFLGSSRGCKPYGHLYREDCQRSFLLHIGEQHFA